jgi:hypothetical protein
VAGGLRPPALRRRLLASTLALLAWLAAGAAASAQIAPHRAVYALGLAGRTSALVDADGAFAVEWRTQCEGVTSRQRLWFVGSLPGGGELDYDIRFSTWESADDRRMRFSMRTYRDGDLADEFRGQAQMPEGGGPGRATYTVPEGVEMRLPAETLFPTAHIEHLIEAAAAGSAVSSAALFDGAGVGNEALTLVTAAIGDPIAAADGAERAWPMALAHHPLVEAEADAPLFELSFELSEAGVMRHVLLDYGAFALEAELERFERLNPPSCD